MPEYQLRFMIHPEQCSYKNMAIDESLLRYVNETGQPVLRCYGWADASVSIGYFQKAEEVVPEGRSFVRRYTGGGLVDHRADHTYSIIVPQGHPIYAMGTASSYAKIHEAIAQSLHELGVANTLANDCSESESPACFQKPVKFDVVAGTDKLAGAAQRRNKLGCLHQGSILVPELDKEELHKALLRNLLPLLAKAWETSSMSAQERAKADYLTRQRYSTYMWNYSR
ncbi:MAG: lipoate--protein ligase family protein [Verrucomicrobiota bacterium]